ncbi:MAG: outer membrane beta-barrel protein [Negativicutes bacterium]
MKPKFIIVLLIGLLILSCSVICLATDTTVEIAQLNAKLTQSGSQLQVVEKLNSGVTRDLLAANESLSNAVANEQTGKNEYDKASAELDNAMQSHYSDPVAVSRLQQQKNIAWQNYLQAQSDSNIARSKVSALEKQRNDYSSERQRLITEINAAKAELFDIEFKTPVWVDGYGEAVMTKTTSHADCENAAVQAARRDAIEKAGGIFISSVTVVENNQVTKDEIKARVHAEILRQDTSGNYGKTQFQPNGDYGKYCVSVRLLVQNTSDYNPYRNVAANSPVVFPTQNQVSGRAIEQPVQYNTYDTSGRRIEGWLGIGYGLIAGSNSTIYWTSPTAGNRSYANNFQRGELAGLALEGGVKFNDYFSARANFSYFASKGDVYAQYETMWLSNGSINVDSYKIAAQLIAACPFGEIKPYIGFGAGANITTTVLANTYGTRNSDLPNSGTTALFFPISAGLEWMVAKDTGVVADYTYNYSVGTSADQFALLAPQSQLSCWLRWYF